MPNQLSSLRTVQDVAEILDVSLQRLNFVLYGESSVFNYRNFEIRKKSGGIRIIAEPSRTLKSWQRILNELLSEAYRARAPVYGFVKNRNIVDNARIHRNKRWILNVDIENFFNSIHFGRVRGLLMAAPYRVPAEVAAVVARLCCDKDGILPQGAPTSPTVSNMICVGLDQALANLASANNCIYSRYADDISFSSNTAEFPSALAAIGAGSTGDGLVLGEPLIQAIEGQGFRLNGNKSRLQHRSRRQEVTGLTVNLSPNISRRFLDGVRGGLHAWERYGYPYAQETFERRSLYRERFPGNAPPALAQVLRGRIEFIKLVKTKDHSTFRGLANRLNRLDPRLIRAYPPVLTGDQSTWWDQLKSFYEPLIFLLSVSKNGADSPGTAFAWGPHHLATASHCTDGNVTVSSQDERIYAFSKRDLRFHAKEDPLGDSRRDEDRDVATLRLDSSITPCSWPVRTSRLQIGEEIAAIGYAGVARRNPAVGVYTGRIEAVSTYYDGQTDSIQTSLSMAGGLSGAPVVDKLGSIIGLVVEHTYEQGHGGRVFHHILPIKYLLQLSRDPDSCTRR